MNQGDLLTASTYTISQSAKSSKHPLAANDATIAGSAPGVMRVALVTGKKAKSGNKFNLTIDSCHIHDSAGNALDGEFHAGGPSGDGVPGGNYQARFIVKGRSVQGPLAVLPTKVVGKAHPKALTAHKFSTVPQAGTPKAVHSATIGGFSFTKRNPH